MYINHLEREIIKKKKKTSRVTIRLYDRTVHFTKLLKALSQQNNGEPTFIHLDISTNVSIIPIRTLINLLLAKPIKETWNFVIKATQQF